MQRNSIIDNLKGVAIFFVVYGHAISLYITRYNIESRIIEVISELIYSFHVPLFLVIAGYLCHRHPLKEYIVKKINRILIPYFFFGALKLIYSFFISGEFKHGQGIEPLIDYLFIGELYWFIYALFVMYLIAILLWKIKHISIYYIIFGILIILNTITQHIAYYPFRIFQLNKVMLYFPYFLIGYILQVSDIKCIRWKKYRIGVFISCIVYNFIYIAIVKNFSSYLGAFIRTISIIIILYIFFKTLDKEIKVLSILAKYSLQLMFFDSFIKLVLFWVFDKFYSINFFVVIIISCINILLGILACKVSEKISIIKKLVGLC